MNNDSCKPRFNGLVYIKKTSSDLASTFKIKNNILSILIMIFRTKEDLNYHEEDKDQCKWADRGRYKMINIGN